MKYKIIAELNDGSIKNVGIASAEKIPMNWQIVLESALKQLASLKEVRIVVEEESH